MRRSVLRNLLATGLLFTIAATAQAEDVATKWRLSLAVGAYDGVHGIESPSANQLRLFNEALEQGLDLPGRVYQHALPSSRAADGVHEVLHRAGCDLAEVELIHCERTLLSGRVPPVGFEQPACLQSRHRAISRPPDAELAAHPSPNPVPGGSMAPAGRRPRWDAVWLGKCPVLAADRAPILAE